MRMHRLAYAVTAVLVILVDVVLVPRLAPTVPSRSRGANMAPNQGTAHAAMGAMGTGFSVVVSGVERSAAPPGAAALPEGQRYVTMNVAFQNDSQAQQRADPHDFRLGDATGKETAPLFLPSPPCKEWAKTDLVPVPAASQTRPLRDPDAQRAGASFGPVALCFAATGAPDSALTLIWDPDVSMPLMDSPTEIPLR